MKPLADKRQLAPYSTKTIRSFALQSHSVRKRYQGEAGAEKIKQMSRGQLEDMLCSVFYYASGLAENFISMLPAPQPPKQKAAPQSVKAAAPQGVKKTPWYAKGPNAFNCSPEHSERLRKAFAPEPHKAEQQVGSRAERAAALLGQGPLASTGPRHAGPDSRAGRAMKLAGMPRPEDAPQ